MQSQTWTNRHAVCLFCTAVRSGSLANDNAYRMVSKKDHPTIGIFVELLNESKCLPPCRIQEVELIQDIVKCAKKWKCYLREITSEAFVPQDKNSILDLLLH